MPRSAKPKTPEAPPAEPSAAEPIPAPRGVWVERVQLSDYQAAPINPNKGNIHSVPMIRESIRQNKAGRPMLSDKNRKMIAGSHSHEAFMEEGYREGLVVHSDGSIPIIFQRDDVTIESPTGMSLQIGDNVIGMRSFEQDDQLTAQMVKQIHDENDALIMAAGFNAADIRHLTAIVQAEIRGINPEEVPNAGNSNMKILDRDNQKFRSLNWGDIMVVLPEALYRPCVDYVSKPEHASRGDAMAEIIKVGLQCLHLV